MSLEAVSSALNEVAMEFDVVEVRNQVQSFIALVTLMESVHDRATPQWIPKETIEFLMGEFESVVLKLHEAIRADLADRWREI